MSDEVGLDLVEPTDQTLLGVGSFFPPDSGERVTTRGGNRTSPTSPQITDLHPLAPARVRGWDIAPEQVAHSESSTRPGAPAVFDPDPALRERQEVDRHGRRRFRVRRRSALRGPQEFLESRLSRGRQPRHDETFRQPPADEQLGHPHPEVPDPLREIAPLPVETEEKYPE